MNNNFIVHVANISLAGTYSCKELEARASNEVFWFPVDASVSESSAGRWLRCRGVPHATAGGNLSNLLPDDTRILAGLGSVISNPSSLMIFGFETLRW